MRWRLGWIALLAAGVCGLLTREYEDLTFESLRIPFDVNVCLVAEDGGSEEAAGRAEKLEHSLQSILPAYAPAGGTRDLHLAMRYSVIRSDALLPAYGEFIGSMPQDEEGNHLITIEQLGQFLHKQLDGNGMHRPIPSMQTSFLSLPVLIVTSATLPKHIIYSLSPLQCTQSAILGVAFMDLTAQVCDLRRHVAEFATHVRWNTPSIADPSPLAFPASSSPLQSQMPQQDSATRMYFLYSRLAGVVTSAVEALVVGNLEWKAAHDSDKIFCPIIILKNNHADGHVPAANGSNGTAAPDRPHIAQLHLNVALLTTWLRSLLLPNHEVTVLHSTHFIDEHPQISVALSNAIRVFNTPHEGTPRSYIDSVHFLQELRSIGGGDALCDQLLSKAGHNVAELMALEQQAGREQHVDFYTGSSEAGKLSAGKDPFEAWDEKFKEVLALDEDEDDEVKYKDDPPEVAAEKRKQRRFQREAEALEKEAALAKARRQEKREATRRDRKKLLFGTFKKKAKRGQAVRIVPVFVLSGMLQHMEVLHNNAPADSASYLPLLDGQFLTVVRGDVVLALHSDMAGGSEMSDINSGIAMGLTEALTGLKPPHLQLLPNKPPAAAAAAASAKAMESNERNRHGKWSRGSVIDLTWTHGSHPFPPFSYLHSPPVRAPEAPPEDPFDPDYLQDNYGASFYSSRYVYKEPERPKYQYIEDAGILPWSAKRSVLIARLHDSLRRCKLTWHRGRAIVDRLQGVLHMLQGSISAAAGAASPLSDKSESNKDKDRPAHELGVFKLSEDLRNALPVSAIRLLTSLQGDMNAIRKEMKLLVDSFGSDGQYMEVHQVVSSMHAFDDMLAKTDASLHALEGDLIDELAGCRIAFTGDKTAPRGRGSSLYQKHASQKNTFAGIFVVVPIVGGFLLLGGAALVLLRIQQSLEKRNKKVV